MKYLIKERLQNTPGIWEVTYETWEGCKCGGFETKKITVQKESMPLLRDVIKAEKLAA